MTLVNTLYDNGGATKAEYETVVQLLNPFAPHMTEELWEKLGHSHDEQLAYYPWPQYEEAKCVEAMVEIAVQVNGKVKARLKVAADITSEDAIAAAKAEPAVAEALAGKTIAKEIYVKGRLVNLAVKLITSQSRLRSTALLIGEPLAYTSSCARLPRPPLRRGGGSAKH